MVQATREVIMFEDTEKNTLTMSESSGDEKSYEGKPIAERRYALTSPCIQTLTHFLTYRLVNRIDLLIIPLASFIHLAAFLDRINVVGKDPSAPLLRLMRQ